MIFFYSNHAARVQYRYMHNPALTNDPFCPFRQVLPFFNTGKLIGIAGYSSSLRNGIGWSGSYTYLVGSSCPKFVSI